LFHLLKNPIYRGMIVHKGKAYPGEHQPIVEEELWDAVQAKLAENAPPRKRATNGEQDALLKGLLTDPHGRPMVPTFTCKGTRRYRYYETRRDLAVPGKPEATRFAMRLLDRHVVEHLLQLLADEHSLRRLSGVSDGAGLQKMFAKASGLAAKLGLRQPLLRQLVRSIAIATDHIELLLEPNALGVKEAGDCWRYKIDLPAKRPFREAKVRIDAGPAAESHRDPTLLALLQDATEVRELVTNSGDASLNHLARRESRCRKQLARLLRVSWLSPRIVESIMEGRQPERVTRRWLLEVGLPTDWSEQEQLLGFVGQFGWQNRPRTRLE
jgi:hypothetical protein